MPAITAAIVKELRERTGSGMMDCKKALAETDGDMEKAIDYLREKGLAKAAKKAERTAKDGRVFYHVTDDGKLGAMVELNSETDFVAKTDEFNALGDALKMQVIKQDLDNVEALLEQGEGGKKIADMITATIAKLGENIVTKRFVRHDMTGGHGKVFHYLHSNYKVGAMLELDCQSDKVEASAEFNELGHELAMQIAAAAPMYLVPAEVPADVLDRERDVARQQILEANAQAQATGKGKAIPENRIDGAIEGKVRKYYETACLLEQEYIRDPKKKIKGLLEEISKQVGETVSIKRFSRFSIGE